MAKRPTSRKRSQPEALQTVPDRLPAPEPGDAADRAQQSEPIVSPLPVASDASPLPTESQSMASEPAEEDIRLRAYHRFLRRGGQHGGHFDDWIEAENELKKK